MSIALSLPVAEVEETSWNQLSPAEKFGFTKYERWPFIEGTIACKDLQAKVKEHRNVPVSIVHKRAG